MKDRIEVENRNEAWSKASSLFPFDFEKDEFASKNAGYPIYRQNGGPSWISELSDRLELTIVDAKGRRNPDIKTNQNQGEKTKMKKKALKEIMVSVRVTPELFKQIQMIASSKGTSNASIIREAVIFFLSKKSNRIQ